MIEFFLSPSNTPFAVALAVMIAFTAIEIISASLGMGLSEMVDSLIPEFDADVDIDLDIDADIDADVDIAAAGGPGDSLIKLLAWFRVGEVPVLMLFILFLTGFGLSGISLQFVLVKMTGKMLPTMIAVVPAILFAIPVVRVCGGFLGKYMPKDETYAVSEDSFLGMVVTITLGTAQDGKPVQAKLRDQHGQTHYVLVEPDKPEESFSQGDKAIIVSQSGAIYKIIAATSSAMTDE